MVKSSWYDNPLTGNKNLFVKGRKAMFKTYPALIRQAVISGLLATTLLAIQPAAIASAIVCGEEAGSPDEPNFEGGISFSDIRANTAISACKKALAEERSPSHLYRLARALYKGEQYQQAMLLAEESAALGYGPAQGLLGYARLLGNTVTEVNYPLALSMLKDSLAKGVASSAGNLAYMYAQGVGVEQSDVEAAKYYLAGSELGNKESQYWLGWLYLNKKELGKTSEEAVKYYKLSAEQNYGPAALAVGYAYEMGNGAPQSLQLAHDYYKAASDLDLADAKPHYQRIKKVLAYQSDLHKNDWQAAQAPIVAAMMDQSVVQVLNDLLPEPIVETLYLPFYDTETSLVRARYGLVSGVPVASYFLHRAGEMSHLSGASTPIHEFNTKHPLYLHAPEIAEHYLWFFTFFTRGGLNGQYLIVNSIHDELIPDGLTPKELALLDQKIAPHECKAAEDSGYLCQADVYHLANIFRATMPLPLNGRVAMTDDSIIVKGLSKTAYSPITLDEIEQYIYSIPKDTPIGIVEMNLLSGLQTAKIDTEIAAKKNKISALKEKQKKEEQQQKIVIDKLEKNKQERQALLKRRAAMESELLVVEALKIIADTGRNQEAFDKLTAAAAKNNIEAEHELSLFYLLGKVVKKDEDRAIKMMRDNADAGFVRAQSSLGRFLYDGLVLDQNLDEAFHYNTLAATQGNARAQNLLATQYDFGKGVKENDVEALKWYRKSADQGYASAQFRVGESYDLAKGVARDRAEAVKWYRLAVEQGNSNAQYNLATSYEFGRGVKQDKVKAHKLYELAADQGHHKAYVALAINYSNGDGGVAVDHKEAVKWYQKSADEGNAKSQYFLGRKYELGKGVDKDPVQAQRLYILAARQGFMLAQRAVAMNFSRGKGGLPESQKAAVKWYRKAAEQGDAKSQYLLGTKYDNGRGVDQDKTQAHNWYLKAADQGYASAQFTLGSNFAFGDGGVAVNQRAANQWYRLAAEQGHARAQGALGVRYVNGKGVPKDRRAGIQWLKKAADQGHEQSIKNLRILGVN